MDQTVNVEWIEMWMKVDCVGWCWRFNWRFLVIWFVSLIELAVIKTCFRYGDSDLNPISPINATPPRRRRREEKAKEKMMLISTKKKRNSMKGARPSATNGQVLPGPWPRPDPAPLASDPAPPGLWGFLSLCWTGNDASGSSCSLQPHSADVRPLLPPPPPPPRRLRLPPFQIETSDRPHWKWPSDTSNCAYFFLFRLLFKQVTWSGLMPHVHVLHYGVCLLTAAALVIITTLSTTPDSPHNQGNVHFPTYLHSLPALVSSKLTQKKIR